MNSISNSSNKNKSVYDQIFDKHVKRLHEVYKKKAEIINDIAKDFEDNGMRLEKIASEIKKRLREHEDLDISDRWIEKILDEKYKRPPQRGSNDYKSIISESTGLNSVDSNVVDSDKKVLEQLSDGSQQTRTQTQGNIFSEDTTKLRTHELKDLQSQSQYEEKKQLEAEINRSTQELRTEKSENKKIQNQNQEPRFTTLIIGQEKFPSNWDKVFNKKEDNVFVITLLEDQVEKIKLTP